MAYPVAPADAFQEILPVVLEVAVAVTFVGAETTGAAGMTTLTQSLDALELALYAVT
jgi:hypothetical protein